MPKTVNPSFDLGKKVLEPTYFHILELIYIKIDLPPYMAYAPEGRLQH